jgi:enoyl ACP reductase
MNLEGKRLLITGVSTRHSIAFAIAEQAQLAGAEIVLSSFGRMRRLTERAAKQLPQPAEVLALDVNRAADILAVGEELERRWGSLDGVVHSIAWAPPDALSGNFVETPTDSALLALQTSAISLQALVRGMLPLLRASATGGSVVGLDFDASVAWPGYDWMGVSKAALEAVSRYLARDLGANGIRVNLVSAGPLKTPAAGALDGFSNLAARWENQAPLGWDPTDPSPVARVACFLLSEWSQGVTGEIVHVDGGYHAMGTWLRTPDRTPTESRDTELVASLEGAAEG